LSGFEVKGGKADFGKSWERKNRLFSPNKTLRPHPTKMKIMLDAVQGDDWAGAPPCIGRRPHRITTWILNSE
jgi:hypothetical protein